MEVIMQVGITWRVACIWPGGRDVEKRLKARKESTRLCPICKAERIVEQMFDTLAETDENWLS
jgi:hypothetical protein